MTVDGHKRNGRLDWRTLRSESAQRGKLLVMAVHELSEKLENRQVVTTAVRTPKAAAQLIALLISTRRAKNKLSNGSSQ